MPTIAGYDLRPRGDYRGARLEGLVLSPETVVWAEGERAEAADAHEGNDEFLWLEGCDFRGGRFRGASFVNCWLVDCRFDGADLGWTRFGFASRTISDAELLYHRTVWDGARLEGSSWPHVRTGSARRIVAPRARPAALPIDWWGAYGELWPRTGRTLVGADFTGAQLSGADFSLCVLSGASFRGAELARASFARSYLAGEGDERVDLRGANLERANFSRADCRRVRFGGANVAGVVWDGADLAEADFDGVDRGRLPTVGGGRDPHRDHGARVLGL